jgi:NAD(P)-dependent dehydrogenase (short-subunit alcohol dehydrogenase family)
MELEGKVAIITGASSGIGEAAACLFAGNGASVVLGARRADRLAAVVARIRDAGGRAESVAGDVRDESFHRLLVDKATTCFGGLDIALNNAGILGDLGPLTQMSTETWNDVIATNLSSGFHAARVQIPAMLERGGGSLIFTSSFVGHTMGLPGMSAYAASKAGLIGLTQVLAVEHGDKGLRVNALLPGGTLTEMAGTDPAVHAAVGGFHALRRLAAAKEIAQAALFLASNRSSFVTGSAMLVDGGNSITKC